MSKAYAAMYLHLVWGTWDRAPLLTLEIERGVYRVIAAECVERGAEVIALGGTEDHLHLLMRLHPAIAPAERIKQMKGVSSHVINTRLAPGSSFRWRGAYGAVSVSPRHLRQVAAYIAGQKEYHAAGSLIPTLERLEESPLASNS